MYSARSHADNCVRSAVMSHFQPGYLQKLLPESAPEEPEALEDILNGTFPNGSLKLQPFRIFTGFTER